MLNCNNNCKDCDWNKKKYIDQMSGLYTTVCLGQDPYWRKTVEEYFNNRTK